jgi:hypothetical protein
MRFAVVTKPINIKRDRFAGALDEAVLRPWSVATMMNATKRCGSAWPNVPTTPSSDGEVMPLLQSPQSEEMASEIESTERPKP